jgi:hypothetical protein
MVVIGFAEYITSLILIFIVGFFLGIGASQRYTYIQPEHWEYAISMCKANDGVDWFNTHKIRCNNNAEFKITAE